MRVRASSRGGGRGGSSGGGGGWAGRAGHYVVPEHACAGLDECEYAHAELGERRVDLGLMCAESRRELGLVEVGRALGLWKGDVEQEEHLEEVVKGDPARFVGSIFIPSRERGMTDEPGDEPFGDILNADDTGEHRPVH